MIGGPHPNSKTNEVNSELIAGKGSGRARGWNGKAEEWPGTVAGGGRRLGGEAGASVASAIAPGRMGTGGGAVRAQGLITGRREGIRQFREGKIWNKTIVFHFHRPYPARRPSRSAASLRAWLPIIPSSSLPRVPFRFRIPTLRRSRHNIYTLHFLRLPSLVLVHCPPRPPPRPLPWRPSAPHRPCPASPRRRLTRRVFRA